VSVRDLLARTLASLDANGIPHMLAGSFASTFHGKARTTQDIDLVIDPSPAALDAFTAEDASYPSSNGRRAATPNVRCATSPGSSR
jgi:hypothetical protein